MCWLLYSISGIKITVTPITTLNNTYKNAISIFPFLIKSPVSNANVENVVNPPQTPTFKNNMIFFSVDALTSCIVLFM